MDRINVCAVCMHSEPGEVQENLRKTKNLASEASLRGADIICFPELSITGYLLKDPLEALSKFSFDYVINQLIDIAKDLKKVIIAGLVEPTKNKLLPYISQVIVGANGLIGIYRKTHLSPIERNVYNPADKISIYSINDISFGIQLCYETHFPEISTIMALMGVDIIFAPHASPRGSPKEKLHSWLRHLRARAFDNRIFVIACNQVGKTKAGFDFPGVAVAIGPDGEVMNSLLTNEDNILSVTINKHHILDLRNQPMKYFLSYRRPELYKRLIEK